MVFCIDRFSSALCLALGTGQGLDRLSPQCFYLIDESGDVNQVISALCTIFYKELMSIVNKIVDEDDLTDFSVIMTATLPLYMEISANPTYFSFLLVCSLAQIIVSEIFHLFDCFSTAVVTSFCLRNVYKKCYKDLFNESEDHESLGFYCTSLHPRLISEDYKILLPGDIQEEIKSVLRSLIQIDRKNFVITDSEMKMFYDMLAVVPCESVSPMTISESHSPSSDEEESMNYSNLHEHETDSSVVNKICELCESRCSEFLDIFQREVLENDDL